VHLLRGHEHEGPHTDFRFGISRSTSAGVRHSQPEISKLWANMSMPRVNLLAQEDVGWLDVPMDDALPMNVLKTIEHFTNEIDRVLGI
jgi:hypothetical protein